MFILFNMAFHRGIVRIRAVARYRTVLSILAHRRDSAKGLNAYQAQFLDRVNLLGERNSRKFLMPQSA